MRQITFEVPSQVALDFVEEMALQGIEAIVEGVDEENFILRVEYEREDEKIITGLEDYLKSLIDEDENLDEEDDEEEDDEEEDDDSEQG